MSQFDEFVRDRLWFNIIDPDDDDMDQVDMHMPMLAVPNEHGDQIGLGHAATDPCILLIFSKHTLNNLARVQDAVDGLENMVIGLDGTFKVNNLGWQVLVIGAHDFGHRVHTVAHIVMSHRSTENYEMVRHDSSSRHESPFHLALTKPSAPHIQALRTLLDLIATEHVGIGEDIQWEVTMTDAEDALGKAIANVYGDDVLQAMCWYHVKACVKKRVQGKPYSKAILDYIKAMHFSKDDETFAVRLQEFFVYLSTDNAFGGREGKREAKDLWLYFLTEWTSGVLLVFADPSNPGRQRQRERNPSLSSSWWSKWRVTDLPRLVVRTNNSVESSHKRFKEYIACKVAQPLKHALEKSMERIENAEVWDNQIISFPSDSCVRFLSSTNPSSLSSTHSRALIPFLQKKLKAFGISWSRDTNNHRMVVVCEGAYIQVTYHAPAKSMRYQAGISAAEDDEVVELYVCLPRRPDQGHLSCSCVTFYRDGYCAHIIATAARISIRLPQGWPSVARFGVTGHARNRARRG